MSLAAAFEPAKKTEIRSLSRLAEWPDKSTAIRACLKNGGTLEPVAIMADYSSTRTTWLHFPHSDQVSHDDVEWILV